MQDIELSSTEARKEDQIKNCFLMATSCEGRSGGPVNIHCSIIEQNVIGMLFVVTIDVVQKFQTRRWEDTDFIPPGRVLFLYFCETRPRGGIQSFRGLPGCIELDKAVRISDSSMRDRMFDYCITYTKGRRHLTLLAGSS